MKQTLLITGITGFIGKNILKFIELEYKDNYEIILLSSVKNMVYKTILHKNYTFNKNDFIVKGVNKIDIILHIGAFTPKSGTEANNIKESNLNILNTEYLLDNLPNTPSKFIFLSTLDVYGRIETTINEKCMPTPLSMYGWSKLYCEKMLESWAIQNNTVVQILRVGHIYGKGEEAYKKVIPVSIQKLKNGEALDIFGTGEEKRSFLHVTDVCSLIMKSISLQKYEGVINLCSSRSHTIKNIVEMLIEISNKDVIINYIKTENKGINFIFDTSKMNQLLGYEKVKIMEGLKNEYN